MLLAYVDDMVVALGCARFALHLCKNGLFPGLSGYLDNPALAKPS